MSVSISSLSAGSDAMGNVDIENVKSYMKQLTTDNFKISDSGAFACPAS